MSTDEIPTSELADWLRNSGMRGTNWDLFAADRLNNLQAQVDAVRELHQADDVCRNGSHMCNECLDEFPCATIRALDGDE